MNDDTSFFDYFVINVFRFIVFFIVGYTIGSCTLQAADTRSEIVRAAHKYGEIYSLDPQLILAVVEVESNWNPNLRGQHGEIGLMQLRPEFHPDAGYDIESNIKYGAAYLAFVRMNCPAQQRMTWIHCYNSGLSRKPKHPELLPYYKKVIAVWLKRKNSNNKI